MHRSNFKTSMVHCYQQHMVHTLLSTMDIHMLSFHSTIFFTFFYSETLVCHKPRFIGHKPKSSRFIRWKSATLIERDTLTMDASLTWTN